MARSKIPGSGRKKGTRNKATAEIKDLAREHGPFIIEKLVDILANGTSETARIAAAKELLDRGYGKSTAVQELSGPGGAPLSPPRLVIQTLSSDEDNDNS